MKRRHLFIQLGTYPIAELSAHLAALYVAGGPLVDLVVTFTGRRGDGALYEEHLAVLEPYLPWGSTRIAGNVFFGTQVIDYTGYTDTWGAAIKDPVFRWKLITQQRAVLNRLAVRYEGKPWHFYIEHEAALDKLVPDAGIAAGYEAFLIQSVRDFRQIKPNSAVAWSPAFFRASPAVGTADVLDRLFTRVKAFSGGPGVDWILLQDMGGRGWLNPTVGDVKAWMAALGTSFRSKQVNVEQFQTVDGQILPGDPTVIAKREAAYRAAGLDIGASWEMRWYMRQLVVVVPPPPPPSDTLVALSKSYTAAPWPRLAASNTWLSNRNQVKGWLSDGVHRGTYSRRAQLAELVGKRFRTITGLEVQGIRYMRPYVANPSTGRAVNSDHLTAGAIDIFFRTTAEKAWLPYVYETLRILEERHIVRYIVRLGANAAHHDHIHVSFQIGAKP